MVCLKHTRVNLLMGALTFLLFLTTKTRMFELAFPQMLRTSKCLMSIVQSEIGLFENQCELFDVDWKPMDNTYGLYWIRHSISVFKHFLIFFYIVLVLFTDTTRVHEVMTWESHKLCLWKSTNLFLLSETWVSEFIPNIKSLEEIY